MKIFDHAVMVDVELSREHFTWHSLQINSPGKEGIAKRISEVIRTILI
jgi:hypothetical protein